MDIGSSSSKLPANINSIGSSSSKLPANINSIGSSSSQLPANINSIGTPAVENKDEKDPSYYLPLYIATLNGDWESAERFFKLDPHAITAKIVANSKTALHVAVGTGKALHFVENLVGMMPPEALAKTDDRNMTALTIAASVGNIEAAKLLVTKNADLPNILDEDGGIPLHRAAQYGRKDMFRYLLGITRKNIEPCPFADKSGALLLYHVMYAGFYDMALDLVQSFPKLALRVALEHPLIVLAGKPSEFPSGSRLNFWHRTIHFLCRNLEGNLCQVVQALVPQLKHIRDMKLMQHHVLQMVKILCTEISSLQISLNAGSLFITPTLLAAKHGVREIVEEITDSFPYARLFSDDSGHNIISQAIIFRQENVFNLIYKMGEHHKIYILQTIDRTGNNFLHLAANLAPPDRLNLVSGAALQMQRELQWFKEVEKFVEPAYRGLKNLRGKTPQMLFSEEHKHLVIEGEKWMKDSANSCTVAAALIATVVFAAAITVPGGNNGDSGLPIFSREKAFIVFAVSDALSLFSSSASLLMFLSILTSRYAETDFLYALPKRLIIGLVTLFLSIATMMVAFSSTLYIVFGDKNPWILSLIAAAACLPVTLFAFLIFPLLMEMISSTYGRGIFGKQSERRFF